MSRRAPTSCSPRPRPSTPSTCPSARGRGICGLLAARDLLGLPTEIVGVVTEGADATARSFAAGRVVPTDRADTFVDGVATRVPDETAVARIVAVAARIVRVSEDAAAEAMRLVFRTTHDVAEPAGALAAAGLAAEPGATPGRRVAMILSGGNVDAGMLADVLAGRTPGA